MLPNRPRGGFVYSRAAAAAISTAPSAVSTPGPVADDQDWVAEDSNILRRIGLIGAMVFVFLKFGFVHEFVTFTLGVNTRSVLIFGGVSIVGMVLSGGLVRTFAVRTTHLWLAFGCWLILTVPFSYWKGGSFTVLLDYFRVAFIFYFVIAGLAVSVRDVRRLMIAAALGGVVAAYVGHEFARISQERMSVEFGSLRNPGDLAAHCLMTMPLLLFVWMELRSVVVRGLVVLVALSNFWVVLSTAARAGLVTIVVGIGFILLRGTGKQRFVAVALTLLAILSATPLLPDAVLNRYATLWGGGGEQSAEAVASSEFRKGLMLRAVKYTLERPLFGLGPGNFLIYDSTLIKAEEGKGPWKGTHDGYVEVSSEAGIPALVLFVGAFAWTFTALKRVNTQARQDPRLRTLESASFCLMLALVIHMTSMSFLSLAYLWQNPVLLGLSAALCLAAWRDPYVRAVTSGGGTTGQRPAIHAPPNSRQRMAAFIAPRPGRPPSQSAVPRHVRPVIRQP